MEGTMAVITCFAANFAPKYWATCDGTLLSIAQNQALFSLIGTTYGGNGTNNFALPDLRGRTPVSIGQGSGLSNYTLGQQAGSESSVLNIANLPVHGHSGAITLQLAADSSAGTVPRTVNTFPASLSGAYAPAPSNQGKDKMGDPGYEGSIVTAGSGQPMSILSPFLVVNYIICTAGIFPSRN